MGEVKNRRKSSMLKTKGRKIYKKKIYAVPTLQQKWFFVLVETVTKNYETVTKHYMIVKNHHITITKRVLHNVLCDSLLCNHHKKYFLWRFEIVRYLLRSNGKFFYDGSKPSQKHSGVTLLFNVIVLSFDNYAFWRQI